MADEKERLERRTTEFIGEKAPGIVARAGTPETIATQQTQEFPEATAAGIRPVGIGEAAKIGFKAWQEARGPIGIGVTPAGKQIIPETVTKPISRPARRFEPIHAVASRMGGPRPTPIIPETPTGYQGGEAPAYMTEHIGAKGIIEERGGYGPIEPQATTPMGPMGKMRTEMPTAEDLMRQEQYERERTQAAKSMAEWEEYERTERMMGAMGISKEAEQRQFKERMSTLEGMMGGLKEGDKAKLRVQVASQFYQSQDELRKTYISGEFSRQAAGETAAARAESQRIASQMRFLSDAQKLGVDIKKLELTQAGLGLKAEELQLQKNKFAADFKKSMSEEERKNYETAMKTAKTEQEQRQTAREYYRSWIFKQYDGAMAAVRMKHQDNPNTEEALADLAGAERILIQGNEMISWLLPEEGRTMPHPNGGFYQFRQGKWVAIHPETPIGEGKGEGVVSEEKEMPEVRYERESKRLGKLKGEIRGATEELKKKG